MTLNCQSIVYVAQEDEFLAADSFCHILLALSKQLSQLQLLAHPPALPTVFSILNITVLNSSYFGSFMWTQWTVQKLKVVLFSVTPLVCINSAVLKERT